MKRFNYFFHISMLCTLLVACDNEFSVENDKVALHVGETVVLNISHASGSCVAEATDGSVVDAKVNEEGKLELFGKDEGNAVVRLTDAKNETIEISVASKLDLQHNTIWIIRDNAYRCSAYAEDMDVAAWIWYELEKIPPFAPGRYILNDKNKSAWTRSETSLTYQFANGVLTLSDGEGTQHRFTIIRWTKDSMTLRDEGLTDYYRSLYPDAGIIKANREMTWTRFYHLLN